jgi:sulfur-oxidizing protein SoxX
MKPLWILAVILPMASAAQADDVEKVLRRDFKARGQATMDRVVADGLQRVCTETHDRPPAELAKQLEADQMKTISFPQGSLMGDWKSGERIAQNGRGMQWTDAAGAPGGGSCYNCHQLSPKESSFGTIGPSLYRFGAVRGNGADMQKYVYGKIYNAKAYNLCSQMPRLGYSGTLTEQQIKDLVALLLDPASPVNQ